MSATEELDHIDRYFSKNWMDEDFPTDEIYAALAELAALKQANANMAQDLTLLAGKLESIQMDTDNEIMGYRAELQALRDMYNRNSLSAWADDSDELAKIMTNISVFMPAREGWKLVPIEPTEEMGDAGIAAWKAGRATGTYVDDCYKAMLEAAPKEPS